jgi:hypothetical protein
MLTKTEPTKPNPPGFDRMKARLGDVKAEALRQQVVAEQAAALDETKAAAKPPKAKTTKTKTALKPKTTKPAKTVKTAEAKPAKTAPVGNITVLAEKNPHKAGTKRHGWFKLLKTGMSVVDAVKAGVRSTYLQRMSASGVIKLSDK